MNSDSKIRVLADQHLVDLQDFVDGQIHLDTFDPRNPTFNPEDCYDAMLIRTVTSVNRSNSEHLPKQLQFLGTGSAGFDHVDIELLTEKEIHFSHAPGCNARAVAEYILTGLLIWSIREDISLSSQSLGIIGVGQVGSAVKTLAANFDIDCILYDPPRDQRDPDFSSATLKDLKKTDILTFHTPLTDDIESEYPTYQWYSCPRMANTNFRMIINAARGGIVDETLLKTQLENNKVHATILDVWENEPDFNCRMAQSCLFSTPHIAGYAIESKRRATKMICDDLYNYFNLKPIKQTVKTEIERPDLSNYNSLESVLLSLHPIQRYHQALRELCNHTSDKKSEFARLRTNMPLRHEFGYIKIAEQLHEQFPELSKLGIR